MENPLGGSKRDWSTYGVASGLGFTIVFSLLLCILGGIYLDRWLGTMPLFTLIGMVLGMAAAGYTIYELAVLPDPNKGRIRLKRRRIDLADDEDRVGRGYEGGK